MILANNAMYLSPDVVAFRARTSGPRGGQGLLVQGNYKGQLSARGGLAQERSVERLDGREVAMVLVLGPAELRLLVAHRVESPGLHPVE